MRHTTRGFRLFITGVIGAALSLGFMPLDAAMASVGQQAPQVVGGGPISASKVPWQVLLLIGKNTLCSGSLISATTVVSAAHCFEGVSPGSVQAWTGVTNLQDRAKGSKLAISSVINHPSYDPVTSANDIAIIQLSAPADIAGAARLIALPLAQDPLTWPPTGTAAAVSGWGAVKEGGTPSDVLQGAQLQVLGSPVDTCGQYGSTFSPANSICAGVPGGGIDTCQGDSGGPLVIVVNGLPVLAGLTSNGGECGSAQTPGVYTRLTTYLSWLRSMTELPVAAPGTPTGIAVSSAAGKTVVSWIPPSQVGGASTVWTATATPGGQTCLTSGTQCAVAGLKLGSEASFTVQGSNALGTGAASTPTAPAVVVSGVAAPGARVAATTIAKWSGLKGSGPVKAGAGSGGPCKMSGSSVLMIKAGLCTVTVSRGKSKAQAVVLVK